MTVKSQHNVFDLINEVAAGINKILDERQTDMYLSGILLLYSFIENLLVVLVYLKIIWNKCNRVRSDDEVQSVKRFCNQQNFSSVLHLALAIDLINIKLFKRVDEVRSERNSVVHQFWLYEHRNSRLVLRKKLEKLAHIANDLVGTFNRLVKKMGADETYDIFLIKPKRGILV